MTQQPPTPPPPAQCPHCDAKDLTDAEQNQGMCHDCYRAGGTRPPTPRDSELLPRSCPHCGCNTHAAQYMHRWRTLCRTCGAQGPSKMTEQEAITAWPQPPARDAAAVAKAICKAIPRISDATEQASNIEDARKIAIEQVTAIIVAHIAVDQAKELAALRAQVEPQKREAERTDAILDNLDDIGQDMLKADGLLQTATVYGEGIDYAMEQLPVLRAKCERLDDTAFMLALHRSPYDISPCMKCGEPVVCIPDGMPMCDPCGKNMEPTDEN